MIEPGGQGSGLRRTRVEVDQDSSKSRRKAHHLRGAPKVWINGRTQRRGPSKDCIYLQCSSDLETGVLCTSEIFIVAKGPSYSTNDIPDEVAQEIFQDAGWSISPTRCPHCISKGLTGTEKAGNMDEVTAAKKQLQEAEDNLRRAEVRERLRRREEELEKYPSEFPPGFELQWLNRHDPFDGYWRLNLRDTDGKMIHEWEIEASDSEVNVAARERAWELVDFATSICKAIGIIKT